MRLTVLGSGTCVPSGGRASSGYWLEAGELRMRLDCGSGTVHAMARFGLPWVALDCQLVSHFHVDHVAELPALLFALKYGHTERREKPLVIAGPDGVQSLVESLVRDLDPGLLEQTFPLEFLQLAPGARSLLAPGVELRTCKTNHTPESLALRISANGRSFGYTGDASLSAELVSFFADVDVLLSECSFVDDKHGTKHLNAADIATLAREARARHLVATHCYFDPRRATLDRLVAADYHGAFTVAEDGLAMDV